MAYLPRPVFTKQTVPLAVIQRDLGTFYEQPAMERQSISIYLDVAAFDIRHQYPCRTPVPKSTVALIVDKTNHSPLSSNAQLGHRCQVISTISSAHTSKGCINGTAAIH